MNPFAERLFNADETVAGPMSADPVKAEARFMKLQFLALMLSKGMTEKEGSDMLLAVSIGMFRRFKEAVVEETLTSQRTTSEALAVLGRKE